MKKFKMLTTILFLLTSSPNNSCLFRPSSKDSIFFKTGA